MGQYIEAAKSILIHSDYYEWSLEEVPPMFNFKQESSADRKVRKF